MEPLRVLLVTDDAADAERLLHELRRFGFDPIWNRVDAEAEFLIHISEEIDVVVSDFSLQKFDAMRGELELLRTRGLEIPLIIISESIGEEAAVAAMKSGAADFLLRHRLDGLSIAVRSAIEQRRIRNEEIIIEEARSAKSQFFYGVLENPLLGIFILQDGRFIFANPQMSAIFGYSQLELLDLDSWLSLVTADDRSFISQQMRGNDASASSSHEFRANHKDGHVIAVEANCITIEHQGRPAEICILTDITARKQAAAAVRRSESQTKAIINSALDCIISIDHEGRIIEFNPAAEAVFGYSREEILGQLLVERLVPEEYREKHLAGVRVLLATGQHRILGQRIDEMSGLRKNGEIFPVELSVTAYDSPNGPVFTAFVRDVTDRKRTETELRESESRLRLLAQNLQAETARLAAAQEVGKVGSWETDLKTFDVTWSSETYRIFEVDAETFRTTHRSFLSLVHPEDRVEFDRAFRASFSTKRSCRIEHRILLQDQRIKVVEEYWRVLHDEFGEPSYAIGTCHDITDRRESEREMQRTTDLLRVVTEQLPDAIYVKDRQGRYLLVNPAAARFVGREVRDILGNDDFILFDEPGARLLKERDRRVMESRSLSVEEEQLTASGTTRTYLSTKAPCYDGLGNVIGVIGISRDITERIRIEQNLRANESKLAEAISIARMGYWTRDCVTNEVDWSNELYDIFGVDQNSFGNTFESFLALVHPEDRDNVRTTIAAAVESFSHTYRIFVRGEIRAIRETGRVICAENGTRIRISGTAQDVTDQWRTEQSLRASEERLLHIVLNSPFPAMVHADDGEVLLISHSWTELTGFTQQDLPTLSKWAQLAYPNSQEAHLARIAAFNGVTSRRRVGEFYPLAKSGKQLTWDFWVTPLGNLPDGRRFVLRMASDITEWKSAQESLRLRDRAIQAVTQGILITDALQTDHPIIYASPGFEKMTGYGAAEVVGRNCRFLQGPGTDAEAVQKLRLAVQEGKSCVVELINYRKDGTPFWNEVSLSPIRDEQGKLTHFVGSQADVTERRRMESQLHQMQKLEAIGRLAGGIAHDFNNLLTIISGYSELLLDRIPKEDPLSDFAEQILIAGERAAGLTQQLLAFSRRQVLQPVALDVNEVIANLERMLRRLIGEDIEFAFELRSKRSTILADRGQMEQVLLNLCLNARDAMPCGGRLTIETRDIELDSIYSATHPGTRPGPHVLFSVSDNGRGMEKSTLTQIFEPFFTTKAHDKGTGLGLATVYGIVRQSDGHIEVYSELGLGTTFKVYLPCHGVAVEPTEPRIEEFAEELCGVETILLVEDEGGVRTLAARFLRDRGYRVLEARHADEALKLFGGAAGEIHLVLTDVVMPGMSGRELVEHLRHQSPEVKVIYMSAYTEDAIVRHGILSAECDFIQKPFTSNSLSAKVRNVLDN